MNPYLYCTGAFTSLNNDLLRRSIYGTNYPSWTIKSVVPDFLLETFECSKDDRYSLYNDKLEDCPAYQIRFCPEESSSNLCMVAKEDGKVIVINTELTGSSAILHEYQAHKKNVFDIEWKNRDKLLTCSGDHNIFYHSLETDTIISRMTSHTSSVKALSLRPNQESQFASCSRDGSVLLWDLRSKSSIYDNSGHNSIKCTMSIYNSHDPFISPSLTSNTTSTTQKSTNHKKINTPKSVTGVLFIDDNTMVTSGASDGCIKFWDIRKLSNKNVSPVKMITFPGIKEYVYGYNDIIVNKSCTTLFASCKDNFIYQYDIRSQNYNVPRYRYTGHEARSYYLKMDLSPDENYIISGSSSLSAYIYRIGLVPQRPVILNGHKREVTVCRWCPSNQGVIMTISDDCTAMVHRMRPGSDYNVFYRNVNRKQLGHALAPVSLSARYGEETVTESNQLPRINKALLEKAQKSTTYFPQMNVTPKKFKIQTINAFLSPVGIAASQTILNNITPNTRRTLGESNIHTQTKIDRSKSVCMNKLPWSPKCTKIVRKRPGSHTKNIASPKENKENLKRRKTVSSATQKQSTITSFWKPTGNI